MVSAMIDECIFETQESFLGLKNRNDFCNRKKESKRRKRINKSYNEIERGEKNNDE